MSKGVEREDERKMHEDAVKLYGDGCDDITRLHCIAHALKIFHGVSAYPDSSQAQQFLIYSNDLYAIAKRLGVDKPAN